MASIQSSSTSKGKWIPGTLESSGIHGHRRFYCHECVRSFDSLTSYSKHLKTELHFKRTAKYKNSSNSYNDDDFIETAERPNRRSSRIILINSLKNKSSDTVNTNINYEIVRHHHTPFKNHRPPQSPSDLIKCPTCLAVVKRDHLGKHLLSYFHFQKTESSGRRIEPEKSLIIENIHQIVKSMPYQCLPCNFYFTQPSSLLSHFQTQHVSSSNEMVSGDNDEICFRWNCSVCKNRYVTPEGMLKHLKHSTEHAKMDNTIQRALKTHQLTCHDTKVEKILMLPTRSGGDNKTLRTRTKRSIKIKKEKAIGRNQCQKCNYTVKNSVLLKRHERTHSESRQRCYTCDICSASFYEKFQLSFHQKIHSEKPLKCTFPGCSYMARCNSEIKCHCDTTHNTSKDFKCPQCEYSTNKLQHYKRHLKLVHEQMTKTLKCDHCPYETSLESGLKRHQLIHATGNEGKPFSCPVLNCDYSSRNIENLRVHIYKRKVHPVGTELYNCPLDGPSGHPSFKTSKFLDFKRHMKEVHGDNPNTRNDAEILILAGVKMSANVGVKDEDGEET